MGRWYSPRGMTPPEGAESRSDGAVRCIGPTGTLVLHRCVPSAHTDRDRTCPISQNRGAAAVWRGRWQAGDDDETWSHSPDAVVGWQQSTRIYNRPAVSKLQKRNLSKPTEVRPVGRGSLELVEIGDTVIGRMTYQPGWHWYDDVRPIVGGELCEIRHVGVVLSGHFHVEMEDGSSLDIGPDDVFEIPPGHDGWVVGDVPWVSIDTEGRRYFAKVTEASEISNTGDDHVHGHRLLDRARDPAR